MFDPKPLLERYERMRSDRSTYDNNWQEVADYILPKRDFTTTRTQGTKRTAKLYDSTALHALEQLAGGLHGRLTPPNGRWTYLRVRGREATFAERSWLDNAANYLFDVYSSPESGFATSVFEYYLDLIAFGNAAMSVVYKDGATRFNSEPIATCWAGENGVGVVDSIYLSRKYRPVEMVRMFGEDALHRNVLEAWRKGQNTMTEVLHVIEPRDEHYGRGAAKERKPFKSCFVDVTNKHPLKEEGFDDMPFMFARWSKRAGETYGYGPGMAALSEVKQLNAMVEIMTRAAAKNADPPMLSPAEGLILPLRLDPGSITFYNPDLGEPKFWQNGFQPNYFDALIEQKRQLIQKMFYVDWLNLPMVDRMTTVEVNQRIQDSLQQLSPMLSRISSEFLSKITRRTLLLGIDNSEIETPPQSLQGSDVVVEYTSPIAIAQKSIQAQAVLQGLTIGAQLAQFDQTVPMYVNGGEVFKDQLLNTFAWPAKYIRSDEEVASMAQQQQEQAQAAQQAQVAETYSSAAKNAAGAMSDVGAV